MSISVLWPDGRLTSGETWRALTDDLRASQWDSLTAKQTREAVARRARIWAGPDTIIRTDNDELFFRDLEAADIIRVDID